MSTLDNEECPWCRMDGVIINMVRVPVVDIPDVSHGWRCDRCDNKQLYLIYNVGVSDVMEHV